MTVEQCRYCGNGLGDTTTTVVIQQESSQPSGVTIEKARVILSYCNLACLNRHAQIPIHIQWTESDNCDSSINQCHHCDSMPTTYPTKVYLTQDYENTSKRRYYLTGEIWVAMREYETTKKGTMVSCKRNTTSNGVLSTEFASFPRAIVERT